MEIEEKTLIELGGIVKSYRRNETVIHEGNQPVYYYQIKSGRIRMANISGESKEFTQGIFYTGESFGTPPLLIGKEYPAAAVADEDSLVIRLPKERFVRLLESDEKLKMQVIHSLANLVYQKSLVGRLLSNDHPEERILAFLTIYKNNMSAEEGKVHIKVKRREIANATGLVVETVIRTLSKMKAEGKVDIIDKKLYF